VLAGHGRSTSRWRGLAEVFVESLEGGLLVGGQVGQDGLGGDLGVALAEGGDELAVDLFAAFALVRVGVEAAEADADIVWEVPGIKIV
jgi:hypothetical protein